jgi:hypothetical protein
MAYFARVLTPSNTLPDLQALHEQVRQEAADVQLLTGDGAGDGWTSVEVRAPDGGAVYCVIHRDLVDGAESLAARELDEFRGEIGGCKPDSAAAWLRSYFDRVRTIYAVEFREEPTSDGRPSVAGTCLQAIHGWVGGIMQADLEGFTNTDGAHILWQFADGVSGGWTMAVLGPGGAWRSFRMDLGDPRQRAAFLDGRVPDGA